MDLNTQLHTVARWMVDNALVSWFRRYFDQCDGGDVVLAHGLGSPVDRQCGLYSTSVDRVWALESSVDQPEMCRYLLTHSSVDSLLPSTEQNVELIEELQEQLEMASFKSKLQSHKIVVVQPSTPSWRLVESVKQSTNLRAIIEDEETGFSEEFSQPLLTTASLSSSPCDGQLQAHELSVEVSSSFCALSSEHTGSNELSSEAIIDNNGPSTEECSTSDEPESKPELTIEDESQEKSVLVKFFKSFDSLPTVVISETVEVMKTTEEQDSNSSTNEPKEELTESNSQTISEPIPVLKKFFQSFTSQESGNMLRKIEALFVSELEDGVTECDQHTEQTSSSDETPPETEDIVPVVDQLSVETLVDSAELYEEEEPRRKPQRVVEEQRSQRRLADQLAAEDELRRASISRALEWEADMASAEKQAEQDIAMSQFIRIISSKNIQYKDSGYSSEAEVSTRKPAASGLLPVGRPLSFNRREYLRSMRTLDCACQCNWCRVNILNLSPLPNSPPGVCSVSYCSSSFSSAANQSCSTGVSKNNKNGRKKTVLISTQSQRQLN